MHDALKVRSRAQRHQGRSNADVTVIRVQDENLIINVDTGEVKLVDFGATSVFEKAQKQEFQGMNLQQLDNGIPRRLQKRRHKFRHQNLFALFHKNC